MSVVATIKTAILSTDRVMPVHYEELVSVNSMCQTFWYEPWMVGGEGVGEQHYLCHAGELVLT